MAEKIIEQVAMSQEEEISFTDFLVRYDGQRMEWHMGRVVAQVTNNTQHNRILFFLSQLFGFFVSLKSLGEVVLAGVPMFISPNQPAREPDLMILLNDSLPRLKEKYLEGAADLAVEIVSPGSVQLDRGAKFEEYEAAGVREYWIIDPLREEVLVYALNEKGHYQRIDVDEKGRLNSAVLQGFQLMPSLLWQENLPQGMEIVKLAQELAN
jgi:Uma2 family endonuclease